MQFKNIAAILVGITASGAIANPVAAEGIVAPEDAVPYAGASPPAEQHWNQDWNNNNDNRGGFPGGVPYGGPKGYGSRKRQDNYIDCNQCQDDDYYDDDDDWNNQNWKRTDDYRQDYGPRGGFNGRRGRQGDDQIDQCGQDWNFQQCVWY